MYMNEEWLKNTDIIMGAIAGGLVALTYWLFSIIFANRTPDIFCIIGEIFVLSLILYLLYERYENNSKPGFEKIWIILVIVILIAFGILPFLF
jgi:hypothetical protein